jgi:hypothetical protein
MRKIADVAFNGQSHAHAAGDIEILISSGKVGDDVWFGRRVPRCSAPLKGPAFDGI